MDGPDLRDRPAGSVRRRTDVAKELRHQRTRTDSIPGPRVHEVHRPLGLDRSIIQKRLIFQHGVAALHTRGRERKAEAQQSQCESGQDDTSARSLSSAAHRRPAH